MFIESDINTPRSNNAKAKKRKSFIEFNVKDISPSKPVETDNASNSAKKSKKAKKKVKKTKDKKVKESSTGIEDQVEAQEENKEIEDDVQENRNEVEKSKVEIKEELDYVNMLLHKDTLGQLKDDDSDGGSDVGSDDGMMDEDDKNDEKFVEEMSALDGKRKKILVTRGSRLAALSEDSAPGQDKIQFQSLLDSLDDSTREMTNRSKRVTSQVLEIPLHRTAAEKITREAGYARVRQEVNIWDSIVQSNRTEESMSFPLEAPDLRWKTSTEVIKTRFTAETPLELQIAAMLAGSSAVPKEGEKLSEIEKRALEGMTKEEINERRAEIAKFRALRGYQATKYKRQSKIKSKSYRKLMRKIKNKEELKQLENLAATDPQAAAERIEKMNKVRILERATLKHRNSSKYMQEQAKRAKLTKDKDLQAVLRDQLATHREMVTKPQIVSDEESDGDNEDSGDDIDITKYQDESYADFAAGYKKYWSQNEEAKKDQMKNEKLSAIDEIENMFDDVEHSKKLAELAKQKRREKKKLLDEENNKKENEDAEVEEEENMEEETGIEHAESINIDPLKKAVTSISSGGNKTTAKPSKDIDPDNFVAVKCKKIKSSAAAEIVAFNDEEDSSEDEMEQRKLIAEAFAEDDVMEDFKKEKAKIIEEATPKDIDLTLPGWGSWGGESIKISQKKRNRFIIKAPPRAPRKDDNKELVIINTDKDNKLRTHQVSQLPAHFTSVSDFEASIRAPIGDTFIPRTAYLKLIKPRMTTKMGHTIEPMNKKALLKKNQLLIDELKEQSDKLFDN